MLNLSQASELFHRNAIAFGTHDGVVLEKALALLGEDAVRFVCDNPVVELGHKRFVYVNCCCLGAGKPDCNYLTLEGFLKGVTYNNVMTVNGENAKFTNVKRGNSNKKSRGRSGKVIPFRRSV